MIRVSFLGSVLTTFFQERGCAQTLILIEFIIKFSFKTFTRMRRSVRISFRQISGLLLRNRYGCGLTCGSPSSDLCQANKKRKLFAYLRKLVCYFVFELYDRHRTITFKQVSFVIRGRCFPSFWTPNLQFAIKKLKNCHFYHFCQCDQVSQFADKKSVNNEGHLYLFQKMSYFTRLDAIFLVNNMIKR